MAFKKKNIPWNKGKKGIMPTPWNKGTSISEAIKNKISNALKGRISPKGMLGKHHSEKTKEKLRLSSDVNSISP